jgi:hypothetical protein
MRSVETLHRVALPVALAAVLVASLVGCVPTAAPSHAPTSRTTPTSSSGPAPTIDLNGTATQNLAYFDYVNEKFIAAGGDLSGRPFIDNLVKAGYDKATMEVTPDRTTVNLAADNISFSIRLGDGCLIGQYGNTGYNSTVQKVLSTGHCLIGTTRTIDW